jgi:hypothetical protein
VRIEDLYDRLVDVARQRVRSGELTERGLSRLCGVSQPHIHNVLKSIRMLSPDSADRLMTALGVTLPELVWRSRDEGDASVRVVPIVRNRIGPGIDAALSAWRGFMPFSKGLTDPLVNPVVAQVAPDLVLPAQLAANDFILLDQNPEVRSHPEGKGCWVVAEPTGLRIRYVRRGGTKLWLANEMTVREPGRWEQASLHGKDISEVVRARIVWMGREFKEQ